MVSFFTSTGAGRVQAGEHTAGPWDPRHQHGGPPAALVARAVEQVLADRPGQVCRLTCELLGPIPVGPLEVEARVVREGRTVRLAEGVLRSAGRDVLAARAWWVRHGDTTSVAGVPPGEPAPPPPESCSAAVLDVAQGMDGGYLNAMEWRSPGAATASPVTPGTAVVWARSRLALVDDEPPSPLARVMLAADSGNGVSSSLPIRDWLFINPELTVHLVRPPAGEWVALVARTLLGAGGVGLAETALWDEHGRIGRGAQGLLVGPRS